MSDNPVKGIEELEDNDPMTAVYIDMLTKVNDLVQEYDVLEVAAIMMTQALSLYKTALSPEDYDRIVENIVKFKDHVIEVESISTGRLH